MIPVILKGETSKPIQLALREGYVYTGCALHVDFCGVKNTFIDLDAGGSVELRYSAEQTARFPLGTSKVALSIENALGEICFMPWAKIKVTDSPDEVHDAQIIIDPATLNVTDATSKDSLAVVKSKLNAVLAFLRGLSSLAVLALPLYALSDVAPLYSAFEDIPGDTPIVTNTAEYVDAKIAAIPGPDFSTNNAALVETIEAKAPAPGNYATVSNRAMTAIQSHQSLWPAVEASTNYTDAALGAFAATGAVSRATVYGTPTRWTDSHGRVWEKAYSDWAVEYDDPDMAYYGVRIVATGQGDGAYWIPYVGDSPAGVAKGNADSTEIVWLNAAITDFKATRTFLGATNLVGRVALMNDIPDVSGYATAEYVDSAASAAVDPVSNLVETVRAESALVYRLYQGSNVVAEVTNYNSQVHAPELKIMQLNESNEYFTVWAETNGLARTLASARQYTDDATNALPATFAPRAWGRTTSGLGFDAPEGMTWVSTSNLVIAGGLEYEKHVTSGGAIWLLESNGMTADFHASGNNTAYLDISAADGTSIFRIEKTDAFLVGVNVDNVSVEGSTLVCGVNVVASEHPLVRVKEKLTDASWAKEEDGIPASLATVTWSGSAGNWTCRIQNNTGGNSFFAQMEYLQEGGTKIVNTAPIDVTPGILCTDGIHKVRPVYSNGNITWEVVP